jgi:hypothetical protein
VPGPFTVELTRFSSTLIGYYFISVLSRETKCLLASLAFDITHTERRCFAQSVAFHSVRKHSTSCEMKDNYLFCYWPSLGGGGRLASIHEYIALLTNGGKISPSFPSNHRTTINVFMLSHSSHTLILCFIPLHKDITVWKEGIPAVVCQVVSWTWRGFGTTLLNTGKESGGWKRAKQRELKQSSERGQG